ncbi:hypothetical protein [Oryzihumus sp.]|jgi:hypothetical protein|uniref:hypothetical protein n=1 Tax=Oryzihumus sp. TaxID=1968903 RepID=UPI002ED94A0F
MLDSRWFGHRLADVLLDDVVMVDQQLSDAVAAYVGIPGRIGVSPEARVVAIAGDAAPDLVPRIVAILD